MFSNKDLRKLVIPLMIEQVLSALMGTADTLMLTRAGEAMISGASLVDSINKLIIFLLSALAVGGTIICSRCIGSEDRNGAVNAARQVILTSLILSLIITAGCLIFRRGLLTLIFGTVEADVMDAALIYFLVTAFSYPFIGLFYAASSISRAAGDSKTPMLVSALSNLLNIIGNAITIFVFHWGAFGAALSTLISQIAAAVVMITIVSRPGAKLSVGNLLKMRLDLPVCGQVMAVGIPTGVENAMFQFGKLIVQSTVAVLGTASLASNALVVALEAFTSMPSMGIGLALVTVVGQCVGAGRVDEAAKYIKKLTIWSFITLAVVNWACWFITAPLASLMDMTSEAESLTVHVMLVISIFKPFLWPMAFTPANGLRAAGYVNRVMILSSVSMWLFRVAPSWYLCRYTDIGLLGIWIGYMLDWTFRSVVFAVMLKRGKWKKQWE